MTVDPDTGELTEDEERRVRPFADWMAEQRNGALHNDLSQGLNDLVDAVNCVGKGGTLTLVVKVQPASKHGEGSVLVADDVKVKLPQERGEALYFVDADANLTRQNPAQPSLPLREVPRPQSTADTGVPMFAGTPPEGVGR